MEQAGVPMELRGYLKVWVEDTIEDSRLGADIRPKSQGVDQAWSAKVDGGIPLRLLEAECGGNHRGSQKGC